MWYVGEYERIEKKKQTNKTILERLASDSEKSPN